MGLDGDAGGIVGCGRAGIVGEDFCEVCAVDAGLVGDHGAVGEWSADLCRKGDGGGGVGGEAREGRRGVAIPDDGSACKSAAICGDDVDQVGVDRIGDHDVGGCGTSGISEGDGVSEGIARLRGTTVVVGDGFGGGEVGACNDANNGRIAEDGGVWIIGALGAADVGALDHALVGNDRSIGGSGFNARCKGQHNGGVGSDACERRCGGRIPSDGVSCEGSAICGNDVFKVGVDDVDYHKVGGCAVSRVSESDGVGEGVVGFDLTAVVVGDGFGRAREFRPSDHCKRLRRYREAAVVFFVDNIADIGDGCTVGDVGIDGDAKDDLCGLSDIEGDIAEGEESRLVGSCGGGLELRLATGGDRDLLVIGDPKGEIVFPTDGGVSGAVVSEGDGVGEGVAGFGSSAVIVGDGFGGGGEVRFVVDEDNGGIVAWGCVRVVGKESDTGEGLSGLSLVRQACVVDLVDGDACCDEFGFGKDGEGIADLGGEIRGDGDIADIDQPCAVGSACCAGSVVSGAGSSRGDHAVGIEFDVGRKVVDVLDAACGGATAILADDGVAQLFAGADIGGPGAGEVFKAFGERTKLGSLDRCDRRVALGGSDFIGLDGEKVGDLSIGRGACDADLEGDLAVVVSAKIDGSEVESIDEGACSSNIGPRLSVYAGGVGDVAGKGGDAVADGGVSSRKRACVHDFDRVGQDIADACVASVYAFSGAGVAKVRGEGVDGKDDKAKKDQFAITALTARTSDTIARSEREVGESIARFEQTEAALSDLESVQIDAQSQGRVPDIA